jgi:hypothetical protein
MILDMYVQMRDQKDFSPPLHETDQRPESIVRH